MPESKEEDFKRNNALQFGRLFLGQHYSQFVSSMPGFRQEYS